MEDEKLSLGKIKEEYVTPNDYTWVDYFFKDVFGMHRLKQKGDGSTNR